MFKNWQYAEIDKTYANYKTVINKDLLRHTEKYTNLLAKTDCLIMHLTETDLSLFTTRCMRAARITFKSSVIVNVADASWLITITYLRQRELLS